MLPSICNLPINNDPKKPLDQWVRKEKEQWLSCRGFPTIGTIAELTNRIDNYLKLPTQEQPKIRDETNTDIGMVIKVLSALQTMLFCLMAESITSEQQYTEANMKIRYFLNQFHDLQDEIQKNTRLRQSNASRRRDYSGSSGSTTQERATKAKWLSSYNFMSILNIPDEMKVLGCPRWHWEGGYRGEGYVRKVKPLITSGLTTNWHKSCFQQYCNSNSMEYIVEECGYSQKTLKMDVEEEPTNDGTKAVILYDGFPHFETVMYSKQCVSILKVELHNSHQKWCVLVKKESDRKGLIPLEFTSLGNLQYYCGMMYFQVTYSKCVSGIEDKFTIVDHGCLLPMAEYGQKKLMLGSGISVYTLVTRNWSPDNLTM